MRAAVVVFPGSHCAEDVAHALRLVDHCQVDMVWHADHAIDGHDLIVLPGGFSYGDFLRAGAIARFAPVMHDVIGAVRRGVPVIGICNGFQILVEAHLLPGALVRNQGQRFVCKLMEMRVNRTSTPFTLAYEVGQTVRYPIAHGEGRYHAGEQTLQRLRDHDQLVFTYVSNPNGSTADIAGICSENGRVLGLMPHPERAVEAELGSDDGRGLFRSLLGALEVVR